MKSLKICLILAVVLFLALQPMPASAIPTHDPAHVHDKDTIHWELDGTPNGDTCHNHRDTCDFHPAAGSAIPSPQPYSAYACWDCRTFRVDDDAVFEVGHGFINEWLWLGGGRDHIPRYSFAANVTAAVRTRVREAFRMWDSIGSDQADHVVGLAFTEARTGEAAEIVIRWMDLTNTSPAQDPPLGETDPYARPVTVTFDSNPDDARTAVAETWYFGALANATAANQYYFFSVALHEIGHVVGLDEQDDPDDIMYYQQEPGPPPARGVRQTIDGDSIHGARDLYMIPFRMPTIIRTMVRVEEGPTVPPVITGKWEQDTTGYLEDGDPLHQTPGAQFLPPLEFEGVKPVQYWAVVTDPEGVATVSQVSVDVYYSGDLIASIPSGYQLMLEKVDKSEGIPAFLAACDAGLVTCQNGYDEASILNELNKCTAEVYMVESALSCHEPAGQYVVHADACDSGNVWASQNGTHLDNRFGYLPVGGIEIDFNSLEYGTVVVQADKWVPGDTVFDSPTGAAPHPNPATVRNTGNTDVRITVLQDDMGFGFSGPPENPGWNVRFGARLGSTVTDGVQYDPHQQAELPNGLAVCGTDELDFLIFVDKSAAGPHAGRMTLGWTQADLLGPPA